ncbi:NADH-quinone oxidoreductase subunit A [bacterium]|nr:NADH-quinone oxidoreductase subunit A [bacterium]
MNAIPVLAYTPLDQAYVPVLVMLVIALAFGLGTMIVSPFFGKNKPNAAKMEPYECGIPTVGTSRIQVFVRFYLVALLFLLFDMEIVYIVVWALAMTNPANAQVPGFVWFSMLVMFAYTAILLVGLIYEWKKGVLNWNK